MRYLPAINQTRNSGDLLIYGLQVGWRGYPVAATPVLPHPSGTNANARPESNLRNVSRRTPEEQKYADLSSGLEEQSLNEFRKSPLEALLLSILHCGPDIPGYLLAKRIAAYREAERIQYADTERAFRFVDLYV
jgi:hypothetical protein